MNIKAKLHQVLALLVGALTLTSAQAALFIDVRDGDTAEVPVSIKDPTRLTLQGAKVTNVFGDVFDATNNPTGRVRVVPDNTGEAYIQPVKIDGQYRPVKIDVRTERGTFGLLLQPASIPGDTIVMVNKGKAQPSSRSVQATSASPEIKRGTPPEFASPNFLRAIKGWMLAMATNTAPEQVEVRPINQEVALWKESHFTLDDSWIGKNWVGDRFSLRNKSDKAMVLDEREFYRPGVLAVTIEHHQLEPGSTSAVWVLRTRTEQE